MLGPNVVDGRIYHADFNELPGSETSSMAGLRTPENTTTPALWKYISEAVQSGKSLYWESPPSSHSSRRRSPGVIVKNKGKEINIKANVLLFSHAAALNLMIG